MNFLQSLSSAVISASTAALAGVGSIPGLPNYILKEKSNEFEGKTIWSLYDGLKKVCLELQKMIWREKLIIFG